MPPHTNRRTTARHARYAEQRLRGFVGIEKEYERERTEIVDNEARRKEKTIHEIAERKMEWALKAMKRAEATIRLKNPNKAPITMKEQRALLAAWLQYKNLCNSANTDRALQLVALAEELAGKVKSLVSVRDKKIEIAKFLKGSYSDAIHELAERKLKLAEEVMERVKYTIEQLHNNDEPFTTDEGMNMREAFILYKNQCDLANTERSHQLLTVAEELADKMKALLQA
jgi:delta 1-pyrroline-5-carboxylate dehydrogenase